MAGFHGSFGVANSKIGHSASARRNGRSLYGTSLQGFAACILNRPVVGLLACVCIDVDGIYSELLTPVQGDAQRLLWPSLVRKRGRSTQTKAPRGPFKCRVSFPKPHFSIRIAVSVFDSLVSRRWCSCRERGEQCAGDVRYVQQNASAPNPTEDNRRALELNINWIAALTVLALAQ